MGSLITAPSSIIRYAETPDWARVPAIVLVLNGAVETKTYPSRKRSSQQSVRDHTATTSIAFVDPRSTCHHGSNSFDVCVTLPAEKSPFLLPSIASEALPPKSV